MLNQYYAQDESPTLYFSPLGAGDEDGGPSAAHSPVPEALLAVERCGYVALGSGELAVAEEQFRLALQIRQKASGAAHAGLPQAFGRLGVVAVHRGDLSQAKALFELGLELACVQRSSLRPEDAMLLHNLGFIAHRRGLIAEAESCYASALGIKTLQLGWAHPSVAATLACQGDVLLAQRRADEALHHFEQACQIHERSSGELSSGLARARIGRGRALLQQGRHQAAEPDFAAAILICQAIPLPRMLLARARFFLARARLTRDPADARALAELALHDYALSSNDNTRAARAVRSWLDRHFTA